GREQHSGRAYPSPAQEVLQRSDPHYSRRWLPGGGAALNSIRRRTLTLIIGLLLVGLLILSVFNVHDSNHEIAEVYDAQLAQNARLLQGVMRMPLART